MKHISHQLVSENLLFIEKTNTFTNLGQERGSFVEKPDHIFLVVNEHGFQFLFFLHT